MELSYKITFKEIKEMLKRINNQAGYVLDPGEKFILKGKFYEKTKRI